MPPLHLLIKPASGLCNMECSYCFYSDTTEKREVASYGIMSKDTLEKIVKKAIDYAEQTCGFAFQGGEPTLAGLDFFQELIKLQNKYNNKQLKIENSIQTNGYNIDEKWSQFFKDNNFLVGLSIDGIKSTHDVYRKSKEGKDTFLQIIKTAEMFEEMGVEYNILTVVNNKTAPRIGKIYEYYKKSGFKYQQYIACLDPLFEDRGTQSYALSPEAYEKFLKELFDLWYMDLQWGRQPYIRQFENYIGILLGYQPESCEQRGICSIQHIIEADGGVYPCDFYVLDEYKIGNLTTDSFLDIAGKAKEISFVNASLNHDPECKDCYYFPLCRGGCERQRVGMPDGSGSRNYYCEAYKGFFEYAMERLQDIAQKISRNR